MYVHTSADLQPSKSKVPADMPCVDEISFSRTLHNVNRSFVYVNRAVFMCDSFCAQIGLFCMCAVSCVCEFDCFVCVMTLCMRIEPCVCE